MFGSCLATIWKWAPPSSGELTEETLVGEAGPARGDGHVRLMPVPLLHQPRMLPNRDPPLFELASMKVDGAQLHHDFVRDTESPPYEALVEHC